MEETTTAVPSETAEAPQVEATTVDEASGEATSETSYMDGKYTSVGALEDGYRELQSTFSKKMGGFEGSPEAYTIPEGELSAGDQANMTFLQTWGAENQLSNDGLNSLAGAFSEHQEQAREAGMAQAFQELGENADRRLANARDYLTANLGEEATQALAANMNTSKSIEAIEALIALNKSGKVAEAAPTRAMNAEKVEAMRFAKNANGERLMSVDPTYRKQVMEAEAKLKGGGSAYIIRD